MKFNKIKLINFRQYKGTHEFILGDNSGSNRITLFIAKNSVGKTTLLQAVRYCFYGSSENYLKLPRRDELINNSLKEELKNFDIATLSVEVEFQHNGVTYIAKREQLFQKQNSKLVIVPTNNENSHSSFEDFSLSYSTESSGYKTLDSDTSKAKLFQILPPGLSHVFMFDGERMEKRIETKEFKSDLKESVLGILKLKKLDVLINKIGSEARGRSLIGIMNSKISHSSKEEKEINDKYKRYVGTIEDLEEQILSHKEKLVHLENEIIKYRDKQKEIEQHKSDVLEIQNLEKEVKSIKDLLTSEGEKYILSSGKAIINKLLLKSKSDFDNFMKKSGSRNRFFQYLHIDTLKDILEQRECLCGTEIIEGSKEEKVIEELFQTALPLESAHHLNKITDKFKTAIDFKEQFNKLSVIKNNISKLKSERNQKEHQLSILNDEVRKKEQSLGKSSQINIDQLNKDKDDLLTEIGALENNLKLHRNALKNIEKERQSLLTKNDKNNKIRLAIADLKTMLVTLQDLKSKKDEEARRILSNNFNKNLSEVLVGNYEVTIDQKYDIQINEILENSKHDVTQVLSTGQSVVLSITFIKSLIETAKTLSEDMDYQDEYGVMMDAALSNVDESHIYNLCKNNINKLSQVIFLSFKRQLRNEMYEGIKDNIAFAYSLSKVNGVVISEKIPLNELDNFIHQIEEDEINIEVAQ